MLLSITIDTTHPDAQGDARTAIELLANTFIMQGDLRRVLDPNFQSQGAPDDASARGVAAFDVEAGGVADDTLSTTPDYPAGPATAPQTALAAASTGIRRLIPGTDTYVLVDVNGLPWDKRIHASTQAFVADGSWRRKPKVFDEDFKRISDELHVIMAAPAAPVPTAAEAFAQSFVQTFTPPAPASSVLAFAQSFAMQAPKTFIEFMTWIGGHSHAQRLTLTNVSDVMAELGLVNAEGRGAVALIDKRPDLIPAAYARLSALLPAREG